VEDTSQETGQLIVVSKVKKFIKDKQDLNVAADFFEEIQKDIQLALTEAIIHAKKMGRKTVMGKDFNFYKDDPQLSEILVVASKIKKMIKTEHDLSTSSQVMEQLTVRIEKICYSAMESAINQKRKTILARDFKTPTVHV
jgi:histone H3/H4